MIAYCGSIDARKHGPTTGKNLLGLVSVSVGTRRPTRYGAYNAYRMPVVRDDDEGVKQARKRRHKESRRLYEKVDTVTEPIATAGGLDGRHGGSSIQYYFSRGSLRDVSTSVPGRSSLVRPHPPASDQTSDSREDAHRYYSCSLSLHLSCQWYTPPLEQSRDCRGSQRADVCSQNELPKFCGLILILCRVCCILERRSPLVCSSFGNHQP